MLNSHDMVTNVQFRISQAPDLEIFLALYIRERVKRPKKNDIQAVNNEKKLIVKRIEASEDFLKEWYKKIRQSELLYVRKNCVGYGGTDTFCHTFVADFFGWSGTKRSPDCSFRCFQVEILAGER